MKTKMVKKGMVLAAASVLALSMTACSGGDATEKNGGEGKTTAKEQTGGEKKLEGFYSSTQDVKFFSAFPEYTYKQATFGLETLETYTDGTYCLIVSDTNFSGALAFGDDGVHDEVPRGANTMKYYGTYTSEEEAGLATVTLSAPEAVVGNLQFSTGDSAIGYVNTEAWTEEMGAAVGADGGSMTAEEYLESVAYDETEITIDTLSGYFDYVSLMGEE